MSNLLSVFMYTRGFSSRDKFEVRRKRITFYPEASCVFSFLFFSHFFGEEERSQIKHRDDAAYLESESAGAN